MTDGAAAPERSVGKAALLALCGVYVLLAALPAAPGSKLVLATAGGSPDWLLGPLRFAGLDGADGPLAGPLFYAGLWVALLLYATVLLRSFQVPGRAAVASICGLHLLFALAPPLLSQDVFSYVTYARLGAEHGLDPYTATPLDAPTDPAFPFTGSKHATSVYGPLFTLGSYALVPLGVAGAFWTLKAAAALASLGVVALVWRTAERLDRDPVLPALAVGLNPHVLVHVVAGAHNEALVMLVTMGGVLAWVAGRDRLGAAAATAATGIKASAALVVPFLVVGSARRGTPAGTGAFRDGARRAAGPVVVCVSVAAAIALVALIAFGADALDALSLISSNQERTSRFSLPYKTAELLGALLPGQRLDYRDAVRTAYGLALAAVTVWLLLRTWRGADAIGMAAWATLAVLVASAWLVPWYALWLLPLAALARGPGPLAAATILSAWMLAIAVPL